MEEKIVQVQRKDARRFIRDHLLDMGDDLLADLMYRLAGKSRGERYEIFCCWETQADRVDTSTVGQSSQRHVMEIQSYP